MSRPIAVRVTLLAAGVLTATLASACSGSPTSTASAAPSLTSATATSAGNDTNVPAPASPAGIPECKAADLQLSHGFGEGAAGHVYEPLRFTNISGHPCFIGGFPGVSYVTGTNGQQVGAPAVRDGNLGPAVTLAPNDVASVLVVMTDVGVFDPAVCQPTPTKGLRVYPPDETAAMFLAQDGTGCAGNPPSAQLRVQTIKAGPGGP